MSQESSCVDTRLLQTRPLPDGIPKEKAEGRREGQVAGAHPVFVCLGQVGPLLLAVARLTQEPGSSLMVLLGDDHLAILAFLGKHMHPSIKITASNIL